MTWRAFPKDGVTPKIAHRRRTEAANRRERAEKQAVRDRDRVCRFPLCGCARVGYALEVSHKRHKGMGGDSLTLRSTADQMILVCAFRHRVGRFAIDRKRIAWESLTPFGANGAVAWYLKGDDGVWVELATEERPGVLASLTVGQEHQLRELARMER